MLPLQKSSMKALTVVACCLDYLWSSRCIVGQLIQNLLELEGVATDTPEMTAKVRDAASKRYKCDLGHIYKTLNVLFVWHFIACDKLRMLPSIHYYFFSWQPFQKNLYTYGCFTKNKLHSFLPVSAQISKPSHSKMALHFLIFYVYIMVCCRLEERPATISGQ